MSHYTSRPSEGEYAPEYSRYLILVPAGNSLEILRDQNAETLRRLAPLDEARALHRYAPEKWSVKEVVGHLIDAERVFSYRALRFARRDETPLPGFDQETFVAAAGFDRRPLGELLRDYAAARAATLALFASLDEAAWTRRGTANDCVMSVRAAANVIAGHEMYHLRILAERYGIPG